jgi:hypothetical protein
MSDEKKRGKRVKRSAISGRKIKMYIPKTEEDELNEKQRMKLRAFYNSAYG